MRDPYRNAYGEYTPMTYTIGSLVSDDKRSALIFRSKQASLANAAKGISESISRIGAAFKEATAAIVKVSV
ncbi:hypothetical protein SEA_ODESZA_49 [Gordonia Phage Odesza]|uniref:Uncharacterized protein n=1 Tax=Gordonia Phage Odesza TaxID=2656527 RepID=A0A649VBC5_9CAUD|nr:hypothetical protein SEA_ODESZA_49 [Gordonia Phage Odesza]